MNLDRTIATLSIIGLVVLAGCAFFEQPITDDWYKAREAVPLTSWTKVKNVRAACLQSSAWQGVACARVNLVNQTCDVFAVMTEQQARDTWWHDGMKVYDHEEKHCRGFDHKASTVRSLTAAQGIVK